MLLAESQISAAFPDLGNIKRLKVGGQKAVYSATHASHGDVVIKIVVREGQDKRIEREIDIIRRHRFPHVPTIFESGEVSLGGLSKYSYICEQRVNGKDLRSFLALGTCFTLGFVVSLTVSLLRTVAALETHGIVHRDINPNNILCDEGGTFWLIDFGIARDMKDVSITETSAGFGPYTPGYAPPEQFRNLKRQVDSRADLFSIGVVAYELLSGVNPFVAGARNIIDILNKTERFAEAPLVIPGDSNGEFSSFVQTMMQKNRTYRPPSAAVALAWLSQILKGVELKPTAK